MISAGSCDLRSPPLRLRPIKQSRELKFARSREKVPTSTPFVFLAFTPLKDRSIPCVHSSFSPPIISIRDHDCDLMIITIDSPHKTNLTPFRKTRNFPQSLPRYTIFFFIHCIDTLRFSSDDRKNFLLKHEFSENTKS